MKIYLYQLSDEQLFLEEEDCPESIYDMEYDDLLDEEQPLNINHWFQSGYCRNKIIFNFVHDEQAYQDEWIHWAISLIPMNGDGVRLVWVQDTDRNTTFEDMLYAIGDAPWSTFMHHFSSLKMQVG